MSLIPSDKFEHYDNPDHDHLNLDSVKSEVVRNERATANISSINEAASPRRSRASAERVPTAPAPQPSNPRISGSPLPTGKAKDTPRNTPGRSLLSSSESPDDVSTAQRALNTMKQALPLVQKLLPLLDGNVVAAVGNLLAPRQHVPQQKLDLAPLESHLTEMQLMHHDLRSTVTEQNVSLKRVEDQLEMVKEATDRNTLEQQELMEDLRSIGSKVNLFAAILFGILIISLMLNLLLFMHIKQVLP